MDDADRAEVSIEMIEAAKIREAHDAAAKIGTATKCAADDCDNPPAPGSNYCCPDCLWYAERKRKARRLAGRSWDD